MLINICREEEKQVENISVQFEVDVFFFSIQCVRVLVICLFHSFNKLPKAINRSIGWNCECVRVRSKAATSLNRVYAK